MFLLIIAMLFGLVLAKAFPESSFWILVSSAVIGSISIVVSNVLQPDERLHFGEGSQVAMVLASGTILGVTIMQLSAWVPLPVWER